MVIFHSYVSLPEGNQNKLNQQGCFSHCSISKTLISGSSSPEIVATHSLHPQNGGSSHRFPTKNH